jgi:4-hydroxy-tetrahydrodipicolinate synthase
MIQGTVTAMATPFDAKGRLDLDATGRLASWLVARGVDALFVGGTTGEGLLLSREEQGRLAQAAVEAVGDRISVLAQVGCASTAESIASAEQAARAGVKGIVLLSPYFFDVDQAAMIAHFAAVAAAAPETPAYLYNIPGNTRNPITPAVLSALLAKVPNLAGIKDSSKDLVLLQRFLALAPPGFAVLVGSDSVLLPGMASGAVGVVSAASNVFPEAVVDAVRAFTGGKPAEAQAAQERLNRLLDVLKMGPPLSGYKAGLALRGMPVGGLRPPLRDMTPEEHARFEKAFEAAWGSDGSGATPRSSSGLEGGGSAARREGESSR